MSRTNAIGREVSVPYIIALVVTFWILLGYGILSNMNIKLKDVLDGVALSVWISIMILVLFFENEMAVVFGNFITLTK